MDYNILVNVKIKSAIQTNYEFKQQDYGQKLIVMAEDYDINGTTARLFINKNDGTVNERIMTKDNDSYTYILDADDTSSAGKTVFDVKYYKQGVRDSSASFIFNIIPDRFGNLIDSKTMSDSLQSALDRVDRTIEIVDEYDEKIEQINKASERAENSATNSVIAVANCEQATNKANVATDRANTAAATAEGIAENKTGVNDNAVGASTTWSSSKINTSLANQIGTANGASINLPNSFNGGLLLKEIQGKSVQNGTPSPTNKVDIVSVGDDGSVVVKVTGKNFIPGFPGTLSSNGMTFTQNSDGSITINGTATDKAVRDLTFDRPITANMIQSLRRVSGTNSSDVKLAVYDIDWLNITMASLTPTSSLTSTLINRNNLTRKTRVRITVDSGCVCTNLIIQPQLELGTTATTYEQYKEQLVTIPLTQPLRGVGNVYDRIIKKDGVWGVERKFVKLTLDASVTNIALNNSTISTVYNQFTMRKYGYTYKNNLICDKLEKGEDINKNTSKECIWIYPNTTFVVIVKKSTANTIEEFRTWITNNPLEVLVEIETPIFEPCPQAIQDKLNALHTNQGVTNVFTTDPQQPNIVVSYGKTDSSALALYVENVSDSKLDKSKSVNNLITTVEGTVLDGRQGRALSEKIGNLSDLKTEQKTDLVGSVNEVKASVDGVNNNLSTITATISQAVTTVDATNVTIPLSQYYNTGSAFNVINNTIICNKNGFVEVSASFKIESCVAGKYYAICILKNGSFICDLGQIVTGTGTSLSISPKVIPVAKNDLITFTVYATTGGAGATIANSRNAYITVKDVTISSTPNTNITTKYSNKNISILGDSISTLTGYSPSDYNPFYKGNNYDIVNMIDTWWGNVITDLGANLLVNNSYGGSKVSGETEPSANLTRCQALHSATANPDLIFVYMGINDFLLDSALGTYDGTTDLPTDNTKFKEALSIMLNKIMVKYPITEIKLLTLLTCEKRGTLIFPERNNNGVSLKAFNDAIKEIGDMFCIEVIDISKCGINHTNLSAYMCDYESSTSKGLHPNKAGHKLIADYILKRM